MSDVAISIEGVGKRYRIGTERKPYKTLRESMVSAATAPWRALTQNRGYTEEGSFWALKDVSFEVKRGEVVGIIGRNGAGKSTLLKILSHITEPTTGRIVLNGRVGSLLEVGTGFHPELTGRENIYLNGAILGMTRGEIKSKFDEIVAFSEIEKFLDTPVKQYSSGMYTRLAFAVAANLEPEILIVDEVLAVGDAAFQKKCLGKMKDVAGQGRTVLFVSHNMAAVEALCTHGIMLQNGTVSYAGTAADACTRYLKSAQTQAEASDSTWSKAVSDIDDNQPAQVVFATIRNGNESLQPLTPRDPIVFTVEVQVNEPISLLDLGIGIDNAMGVRVTTLHTDFDVSLTDKSVNKGKYVMRCTIPALGLTPGLYSAKIALEANGIHCHVIDSAFSFQMFDAQFFEGTTRRLSGIILAKQGWSLDETQTKEIHS